jgi:DNA-binding response OmpR family regulator
LHGGAIGLHSSGHEGAGSTFYFTLPVVALPEPPASRVPGRPGSAECVMVLTDRANSGQRLSEHLSQRGFEVQLALTTNIADWSARLATVLPSAVVLDMTNEPEHGWEILKTLKSNPVTRDVPVLFYALGQASGSVLELDYLTKPIELAELTKALDQHWLSGDSEHTTRAVLVVDDDPDTLDMNSRIVQAHWPAVRVLKASDGRAALEILQHTRIDLVLLDLMMPEIDGFGVLEAMRQGVATRDVPVIVLTGQTLSQQDMARLNQGVAAVMSKGLFSAGEVLAHLDAALERRRKLSSEAQRLVRHAMAYLHEHYAEPISRQDLARHVNMAEDYLTSCFHKEVGIAPIAYLNRYRINQARLLLKQGEASVADIAVAVGFSDSGYFSRVFRREVGMSPEAYRRAQA